MISLPPDIFFEKECFDITYGIPGKDSGYVHTVIGGLRMLEVSRSEYDENYANYDYAASTKDKILVYEDHRDRIELVNLFANIIRTYFCEDKLFLIKTSPFNSFDEDDGEITLYKKGSFTLVRIFEIISGAIGLRHMFADLKSRAIRNNISKQFNKIGISSTEKCLCFDSYNRDRDVLDLFFFILKHYINTLGNFVIYFKQYDTYFVLCHEDDLHVYFHSDNHEMSDKIETICRDLNLFNHVDVISHYDWYYPCD